MRCAKGFAMGKGRADGVLGMGGSGAVGRGSLADERDDEVEGTHEGLYVAAAADVEDSGVKSISSSLRESGGGSSSFGIGGIGGGNEDRPFSNDGKDAAGDGGGRINSLANWTGEGAGGAAILVLKEGGGREGDGGTEDMGNVEGRTSVSYEGSTLV